MTNYIVGLLQKHRKSDILLDTNLLLLYYIGSLNPKLILEFKRTREFAIEDYDTLLRVLRYIGGRILTTPNVLTEVSNLSAQMPRHLHYHYFTEFARGITLLQESYFPSVDISKTPEFLRFGLTDAGIMRLAKDNHLVITTDFPLSQYLQHVGLDALNFNHIRVYKW